MQTQCTALAISCRNQLPHLAGWCKWQADANPVHRSCIPGFSCPTLPQLQGRTHTHRLNHPHLLPQILTHIYSQTHPPTHPHPPTPTPTDIHPHPQTPTPTYTHLVPTPRPGTTHILGTTHTSCTSTALRPHTTLKQTPSS